MHDKNGLILTKESSCTLKALNFFRGLDKRGLYLMSVIFVLVSFLASIFINKGDLFAASGGILTILGLVIFVGTATPISLEEIQNQINSQISPSSMKAGGDLIQHVAEIVNSVLRLREKQVVGLIISFWGTLIWAFGWLVEYLPWFQPCSCP